MKNILTSAIAATIALFAIFTSCKKEVSADGVTLSQATATLAVGDTLMLTATVNPSDAENKNVTWSSSDIAKATVNNGMVIAVAEGPCTITVTTEDGGKTANCVLTIEAAPHPVLGKISFKSEATWEVGNFVWSDYVMATGCKKDDYNGGDAQNPLVDCRQSADTEGLFGDLYSFQAVFQNKEILCPNGWRVPTKQDFIDLDKALGGTGENWQQNTAVIQDYFDEWGAQWGGQADKNKHEWFGDVNGKTAYYWSGEQAENNNGYLLMFNASILAPQFFASPNYGYPIRCVKNK